MDDRPVIAHCFQCGGNVQTRAFVRGKVFCPPCRDARRRVSLNRSNDRARQKRLAGQQPTDRFLFQINPLALERSLLWKRRAEDVNGLRELGSVSPLSTGTTG